MRFFKIIILLLFIFCKNLALAHNDFSTDFDGEYSFAKDDPYYSMLVKDSHAYIKDKLNKKLYFVGLFSPMNIYSPIKKDDTYYLFLENFSSSKTKIQLTFTKDFDHITVLQHSKAPKLRANRLTLNGNYCYSDIDNSKIELSEEDDKDLFDWFYKNYCNTSSAYSVLSSDNDKIIGKDLQFHIKDNKNKKMSLIALGFDNDDGTHGYPYAIGCIQNCQNLPSKNYYTGRLGSYEITMHIKEENGKIHGYYYYNKYKDKIYIEGFKENDKIHLKTKDSEYNETFTGTIEDGVFYGGWENKYNEKSTQLEFKLYLYAYLHFE